MKIAIVVFVIGDKYILSFNSIFKKPLEVYCKKNNYDLIVLNNLIRNEEGMNKKKFFWQRFLIPDKYKEYDYVVTIDSDIYISPLAPPLPFNSIPEGKVAAINERKYLGNYEWREYIQKKNKWEPTGKDWHALSGEIRDYNDHINGGLVIYQPKYHADLMLKLYNENISNYMKYHQDDQSILSLFLIDNNLIHWLDERYNRIWGFWKELFYPDFQNISDNEKTKYILNFIKLNYFTHFTGGIDIQYIPGSTEVKH